MTSGNTQDLAFGRFLKFWRRIRDISQEELAFRLDCSARHVTRVESGQGHPSERFVEELIAVLALGDRDGNHLRLAAGYRARPLDLDLADTSLHWLRRALSRHLRQLDPLPATINNSRGDLLFVNRGWVYFLRELLPDADPAEIWNLWDFLFQYAAPDTENILALVLMALQQTALFTGDPGDQAVVDRLAGYPRAPADWATRAARLEPRGTFWISLDIAGTILPVQSVISTLGAAGPCYYNSEPHLLISTLYPKGGPAELSAVMGSELRHPLLGD